ncbi:SDR family NAD(P)-dependent oxidoreductase, partial [Rhodobacteraceae bacterium 2CG4]
MNLNGKSCIVTGAARGIGAQIAKRFVASGARVAIADLHLSDADATAKDLTDIGPGAAMGVEMNVTDEAAVNAGVIKVVDAWGSIDVLVSNAGIQIVHELQDFPFEDWKKLLSIHLDGAFLTSKACLPHMYKKGSGSVIFMGSVHSKEASPLKSAYVTAKHGLLGLARVISKEGARHGVRDAVMGESLPDPALCCGVGHEPAIVLSRPTVP